MNTKHSKATSNIFITSFPLLTFFILTWGALFWAMTYPAAAANEDSISDIATVFYQKSSLWTSALQKYALYLFYILMILEVVIFGIKATLQRT